MLELNQKKDLQKKREQLIEDLSKHLELDKVYMDKFDYKLMWEIYDFWVSYNSPKDYYYYLQLAKIIIMHYLNESRPL